MSDRTSLPGRCGPALLVGAMAGLLLAAPAAGQELRGLTFVGGVGYEWGGPGPSLVDALREADLADPKEGRCFYATTCAEPIDYPVYFNEGLNLTAFIGARYRFDAPLSIELLFSNGQRGHAEGYNETTRETLVVSYAAFMVTVTGGLHLGPVRLEAGPVLNQIFWGITRTSEDAGSEGIPVFGVNLGAGGGFRVGAVLLSLRAGIRQFPTTDLRPALQVPLEADYRSFYVGVTVLPAAG